jgi:phosphoheptose isomerase
LNRAHEEYKLYVEKYSQVRDNFENKLQKAASIFQEHDQAFLKQFKTFLCTFARSLDDAQGAVSQVTGDYRQSLEQVDIQAIMMKFINERGTGTERPRKYQPTRLCI